GAQIGHRTSHPRHGGGRRRRPYQRNRGRPLQRRRNARQPDGSGGLMKISFLAADTEQAQKARDKLAEKHGHVEVADCDVIVALGGDGSMLRALHDGIANNKPVYGMNRGSVGFLLNEYREEDLINRIEKAQTVKLNPLRMKAVTMSGEAEE